MGLNKYFPSNCVDRNSDKIAKDINKVSEALNIFFIKSYFEGHRIQQGILADLSRNGLNWLSYLNGGFNIGFQAKDIQNP